MEKKSEEKNETQNEAVKNENGEKEVKEIAKVPVAEEMPKVTEEIPRVERPSSLEKWKPKTSIGRAVFDQKIKSIDDVLKLEKPVREPEILDMLVPELKNELILIGGRTGKGGGIQRIPVRITAKMTKSSRKFKYSAFVVIGNEDGLVGIGGGKAPETRNAIEKAVQRSKLKIIRIKRGCGSWECGCGTAHSLPYKISGKSGSVRVDLIPGPKGLGLVANDESKKILRLAGIKDVWVRAFGNTGMRINLIQAIFNALKKLSVYR